MAALRGWRCWRLWRPWSLPPGATVAFPSRAQPLQGWAAALLLPHGAVPTPSCRYASRLPPGSGPRAASQRTVSGRGAAGRDGGVPRSLRPRSPRPGAGTPPSAVCGQRPAPDRALPRQPVSWRALGAALILCGGLLLAMKRVKKAKEDSECSRSPAAVAGGGGGIAAPFSKLLLLCLPLYVLTCAVAVAADAFDPCAAPRAEPREGWENPPVPRELRLSCTHFLAFNAEAERRHSFRMSSVPQRVPSRATQLFILCSGYSSVTVQ